MNLMLLMKNLNNYVIVNLKQFITKIAMWLIDFFNNINFYSL